MQWYYQAYGNLLTSWKKKKKMFAVKATHTDIQCLLLGYKIKIYYVENISAVGMNCELAS